MNMRHGIPNKFTIEQLSKATDDITSLASAAIRVLKKYIIDGEEITGVSCPNCGATKLTYHGGCVSCACGWEKC